MKKLDYFLIAIVLLIALTFRFYKINIPLADFHSWRQADTASVARNFVKNGFNLLHPKYDDLSNIQSGKENPQGYRMVEFPIYNAIFGFLYKNFSFFSLEIWGRLTSIIFSLIIIAIIYYLLTKEVSRVAGFFASFIYAVFPFFVFYSRVILPENTALGFSMLSILFLYLLKNKKNNQFSNFIKYFLSAILFAISLLIKPTTIFFIFPIIYLFYKNYKWSFYKKIGFYLYFLISFLPLVLWRQYINQFSEGIPVNQWLLTSVNTDQGLQKIFFKPAFFRWIFFERINNLILGGYLTGFFILGMLTKQKNYFFFSFLISSLTYLFIFQGGNIQHEYYQILIFPMLTIFSGLGINFFVNNINKLLNPLIFYPALVIIIIFSWLFSFYQVKNYYNYSFDLIQQANIIKSLTDPQDKIITDKTGDTTLLYLSDRKGAPAIYKDPEELKKLGYQYLITENKDQINILKNKYQTVFKNNKFIIFKL